MNIDQLRMARAGLDLSAHALALNVGLSKNTINNIEQEKHNEGGKRVATLNKIREWLEQLVTFIDPKPGEHGSGVILREGAAEKLLSLKMANGSVNGEGQISASWRQDLGDATAMSEIALRVNFL